MQEEWQEQCYPLHNKCQRREIAYVGNSTGQQGAETEWNNSSTVPTSVTEVQLVGLQGPIKKERQMEDKAYQEVVQAGNTRLDFVSLLAADY